MKTIKLFSGIEIPAFIDTTQRIFQVYTYDAEHVLCNLEAARLLINSDSCQAIRHYWNHKFERISKKEVLEMPIK